MFENRPTTGVVDLAAYREKVKRAKTAEAPNDPKDGIAVPVYKMFACRLLAKQLTSSLSVASIDVRKLIQAGYAFEKETQKLLFDSGLGMAGGFEKIEASVMSHLESLQDAYCKAYPHYKTLTSLDYAEDFALYGFRNMKLQLLFDESKSEDDMAKLLGTADKTALIEQLCKKIRLGAIPNAMLIIGRYKDIGFHSDAYLRMGNYYSYSDFELIKRDFKLLADAYPAKDVAMLASAMADGLRNLLDSMPSLEMFKKSIEETIYSMDELYSIKAFDVSTIEVDEEALKLSSNEYIHLENGGEISWNEYAQARYGIDYYAANRLSRLLTDQKRERHYQSWLVSKHKNERETLIDAIKPLTDDWSITIPNTPEVHHHVVSLENGIASISVHLERNEYENFDSGFTLKIHASVKLPMIDHRFGNDSIHIPYIENFDCDKHLTTVLESITKFLNEQSFGMNWAKVDHFRSLEVEGKNMSYSQVVKADLARAVACGVLPSDLKFTVAQPSGYGIRLTITGLPEGMPIYTHEYVNHKEKNVQNYIRHDDDPVEGLVYAPAFAALHNALDLCAASYRHDRDYRTSIVIKDTLESKSIGDVQTSEGGERALKWKFSPNMFACPQDENVFGEVFPANKSMTMSLCNTVHRRVSSVLSKLEGLPRHEAVDPYWVLNLVDSHKLLKAAYKRLPPDGNAKFEEMNELLQSCTDRLANRFELSVQTRLCHDVQSIFNVIDPAKLIFVTEKCKGDVFEFAYEIGECSPGTGEIVNVTAMVKMDVVSASGETTKITIAQTDIAPYNGSANLERMGSLLEEDRIKPAIAFYALGTITESEVKELIEHGQYGVMVRDHSLLTKVALAEHGVKANLKFLDACGLRGHLPPELVYLAKSILTTLNNRGVGVTVIPGRGFSVDGADVRTTAYVDNKLHINLDGIERAALQEKIELIPGVIHSADIVAELLSDEPAMAVQLTEQQKEWVHANLNKWDFGREHLKLYCLDSNALGGALITEDYYGFNLIAADGTKTTLNEAQRERLKKIMSSSVVQVTHNDIKLSAKSTLTLE